MSSRLAPCNPPLDCMKPPLVRFNPPLDCIRPALGAPVLFVGVSSAAPPTDLTAAPECDNKALVLRKVSPLSGKEFDQPLVFVCSGCSCHDDCQTRLTGATVHTRTTAAQQSPPHLLESPTYLIPDFLGSSFKDHVSTVCYRRGNKVTVNLGVLVAACRQAHPKL